VGAAWVVEVDVHIDYAGEEVQAGGIDFLGRVATHRVPDFLDTSIPDRDVIVAHCAARDDVGATDDEVKGRPGGETRHA
jgi:hypothetical protein